MLGMFFIKTHFIFPNTLSAPDYLDNLWALDYFDDQCTSLLIQSKSRIFYLHDLLCQPWANSLADPLLTLLLCSAIYSGSITNSFHLHLCHERHWKDKGKRKVSLRVAESLPGAQLSSGIPSGCHTSYHHVEPICTQILPGGLSSLLKPLISWLPGFVEASCYSSSLVCLIILGLLFSSTKVFFFFLN